MANWVTPGVLIRRNEWYDYDAQNRFTVTQGSLMTAVNGNTANGVVTTTRGASASATNVAIGKGVLGGAGIAFTYDAASQRTSAAYARDTHQENYLYTQDGLLSATLINNLTRVQRTYDAAGRTTVYQEWDVNSNGTGTTARTNLTRVWDADGRETSEYETIGKRGLVFTLMNEGTVQSTKTFTRDSANSANKYDNAVTTTYSYERWDDARQSNITVSGVGASAGATGNGYSNFRYDVNGHLKSAIDTYAGRSFTYITDSDGQILRRDEALNGTYNVNTGTVQNPTTVRQHQYLNFAANGTSQRVGDIGNDGIDTTDYAQVLARDLKPDPNAKALDRFKRFTPVMASNFDTGTNPINDLYPSAAPGNVTVRDGDTLQSIAQSQWGDASLWYLLADANGLTGSETLTAGMVLNVPSKVANLHNNTGTFKVYDAGKAIGDTGPTLPDPPPANKGCGAVGMILAIVVAVVVAALTAGAAAGLMGITSSTATSTIGLGFEVLTGATGLTGSFAAVATAAAVGGAVGSIASQGLSIAMGNQEHFSWKQVGLGALGAAVTAGMGSIGLGASSASSIGGAALNAGIRSVVTQGLGVATGLQDHFSWKAVAASAIAGGVSYGITQAIGEAQYGKQGWANLNNPNATRDDAFANMLKQEASGNQLLRSVTASFGAGVASAAVNGGSLSRQMSGIVQDVIGSTIGNMLAEELAKPPQLDERFSLAVPGASLKESAMTTAIKSFDAQSDQKLADSVKRLHGEESQGAATTDSIPVEDSVGQTSSGDRGIDSIVRRQGISDDSYLVRNSTTNNLFDQSLTMRSGSTRYNDAMSIIDFVNRDDPNFRAYIYDKISKGKESISYGVSNSNILSDPLDMEGLEGPYGKSMRNYFGDKSNRWRDSGADRGQFTKGPDRYDPIGDRKNAGKFELNLEFKWEDKSVDEIKLLDQDLDGNLLVVRSSRDSSVKLKFSNDGIEAVGRLGTASEIQYVQEKYKTDFGKSEVIARTVVDFGLEAKATLGRSAGGANAGFKAELVALQIQGITESNSIDLVGGATAKVKAVGALNLFAVGGSGQAFVECENGRVRAGLGASASALIGAKAQVVVEVDMAKFSFQRLAVDTYSSISRAYNDWKPSWLR